MVISANSLFQRAPRPKKSEAEIAAEYELVSERLAGIARSACPSESDSTALIERRRSERKPVFLEAQLITEDVSLVPCHVIDLSADGARVALENDRPLSRLVTLKFKRSGVVKKARIAWRCKNELGLAFRVRARRAENDVAPAA